jgi:hypothetical protein
MANIGVLINQPYWHDYVDITINDVLKDNYNPDDKKIPCIILQVKKNENKLLSIYQHKKLGRMQQQLRLTTIVWFYLGSVIRPAVAASL